MITSDAHYLAATHLIALPSAFDETQFRQAIRPIEKEDLSALNQFIAEFANGLIEDLACHQNLRNLQSETNNTGQTHLMSFMAGILKESARDTAMACESLAEQVLRFGKCTRSSTKGFRNVWRQKSFAVTSDKRRSDIHRVCTYMVDEISREITLKVDPKKKLLYNEYRELHKRTQELSAQLQQAHIRQEQLSHCIDKPDDLMISGGEEGFDLICRSELDGQVESRGDLQILGSSSDI